MTFSEVTITFVTDMEINDNFVLAGNIIDYEATFVSTRASAGEVTTGTPTGTAGETSAINYLAAFDLDNPTGYVTSQTSNTVTIASEDDTEQFNSLIKGESNVGDVTISFNNFTPVTDTSNIDIALVRSPHYVTTNFLAEGIVSATIEITIWDGDLDTVPGTPTYTLTRLRPTVDAIDLDTNLSELIRSNLIPNPNIDVSLPAQLVNSNSNSVKWVFYKATFNDPYGSIADQETTLSALDGFGYYDENANPGKPTNRILLSNIGSKKIDRNGVILVPFVNDTTYTSVDVSTENLDIDENFVITSSTESTEFIQYIIIDPSQTTDSIVTFTFNGDTPLTFSFNIVNECRYDPKTIIFKNRYGVFESLSMFKKSTPTLNRKTETFVNQFTTNKSYDITKHQYKDINFETSERISLNSGYISEDENESYKQMMLSDQVWFYNGNNLIPVNVDSNDITFKNRVNDRLVNYTIDFKYSYNTIQNV